MKICRYCGGKGIVLVERSAPELVTPVTRQDEASMVSPLPVSVRVTIVTYNETCHHCDGSGYC